MLEHGERLMDLNGFLLKNGLAAAADLKSDPRSAIQNGYRVLSTFSEKEIARVLAVGAPR
jgi:hypothetical protein